jgi:hypothetical protein
MKTTKAKTTSKTKKTTKAVEAVKKKKTATRKATVRKPEPSEEEIRNKAYEIYHQRLARGVNGSSADDWHRAVDLLKDSGQIK